ncbi:flagellar biosynthesis anti-sigma factor FlgM [Caldimonas thermodepolymerans]|mgnify:CR=1 FL=1|jgi:flagellar biosynthesis anti-sigma factor FlgM|uniref:Negative regulator of flagellin synthesis n=1 Tax=Caldimonas thermodepolymerans TaxID=215580 RepID=A0A2S5T9V6_9BURK|nr:flagellar biosynthesis anti-sigma factor FlgM [Caldimonas thermodepolymerans]PPE71739.1 flagellar biosynthesis anti-sigma factor FlgM [Caldimonas thermodepolymerans]QPC30765.1 flagellar biosynthesis anti-sigma factor FlgM [Caldimonas thermodepolymerans]RDI02615.1 FlgM family anti-sigma-28 factor [Caldimonas thermodepolymerans]TCP08857.1 FlgM family anti-sigma-28 factor [Caldimonas thermodepolymerans]UZG43507.1 flagellar biosynthesis anti-sigma factor FlgM [Caldimonas thermodepolymerans]
MKIGNPIETPVVGGTGAATPRPGVGESSGSAKPAAAAEPGNESATVKLSSTATSLLAATPEFDAEKVAAIRQAIADGTYRIDPEAIADKLIANARELLNRPGPV